MLTELLTSLLCEWPFSGKKETFDRVSKVSESSWYAFVISEMTLILAWHVISDAGYFLTKRVQNNMLSRFVLELLLVLPCCCIAKQLLMLIEFYRNIFRSYWKLDIKEKVDMEPGMGKFMLHIVSKALKTGFLIFCMRNKVKSIMLVTMLVLVVRNTSVEISGQQCRFSL